MTIPTQAQIEAAASAIRIRLFEAGIDPVEGLAKAALTAAAEVSVPEQEHTSQKPGQKPDLLPSGNTAAEVGEPQTNAEYHRRRGAGVRQSEYPAATYYSREYVADKIDATIERCAQWLKERDRSSHVHFLADKMCSALKDKP